MLRNLSKYLPKCEELAAASELLLLASWCQVARTRDQRLGLLGSDGVPHGKPGLATGVPRAPSGGGGKLWYE